MININQKANKKKEKPSASYIEIKFVWMGFSEIIISYRNCADARTTVVRSHMYV